MSQIILAKEILSFLVHIWSSRNLLLSLIIYNFKKQYLGSYFGLAWAYIQPLMFIFVIWTVFEFGFRASPVETGVPFALWLLVGIVPWFFFSNAISLGADAICGHAYLVKKVAFRVSILPLVNIGSAFLINLGLIMILIIVLLLNGFWPTFYWIQLLFYNALIILFAIGLSWLSSSIRVFVKDVTSFIVVFLQMCFWLTPIFWSINLVPEKYHYLIRLNPIYYIIDGYRDTFINQIWFWEKPNWFFYYSAIVIFFLIIGALVFKRLRPHFADIL